MAPPRTHYPGTSTGLPGSGSQQAFTYRNGAGTAGSTNNPNPPLSQFYFGPTSQFMNVFGRPGNYNVSLTMNTTTTAAPGDRFHDFGGAGGAGNLINEHLSNFCGRQFQAQCTHFPVPPPGVQRLAPNLGPGTGSLPASPVFKTTAPQLFNSRNKSTTFPL